MDPGITLTVGNYTSTETDEFKMEGSYENSELKPNSFILKVDIALFLQIADDQLKRYGVKFLHNLFIHLQNRTLWPNVRFDTLKGSGAVKP